MRMSWRLVARQLRFEWASIKVSTIFYAWRALVSKNASVTLNIQDEPKVCVCVCVCVLPFCNVFTRLLIILPFQAPQDNNDASTSASANTRKLSFFKKASIADFLTSASSKYSQDSDSDDSDELVLMEELDSEDEGEKNGVAEGQDGSLVAVTRPGTNA